MTRMTTPEDDSDPSRPLKQRKLRPWWRWNLLTLAGVLFVVLWVRELAGMRLADTYWMVLSIFLVWWFAPCLVLRRLPWPLSLFGYLTVGESPRTPSRRRAAMACHFFAIMVALAGCFQSVTMVAMLFRVGSNIGRGGFGATTAILGASLVGCFSTFGIAVGLWTIGSIASAVGRLSEIEEQRHAASDASGPQG